MDFRRQLDDIWAFLERGDLESAFDLARSLVERGPDRLDVLLAWAAVSEAIDDPYVAIETSRRVLKLAAGSGDPEVPDAMGDALACLARCHWRLWKVEEAERFAREYLRRRSEDAEIWSLLARILELGGKRSEASQADQQAARIDPEQFPLPARFTRDQVIAAVDEAVAELPDPFQGLAAEVEVVVEDRPSWEMAEPSEEDPLPLPPDVLGLFTGTARSERSFFNVLESPGVVFLFQCNLERECSDPTDLMREIKITLWHELAHYLGFEEDEMPGLGLE